MAAEASKPGKILEYIGGQMLVAGPILWLAGMYACFAWLFKNIEPLGPTNMRNPAQREKEKLFLSLISLPIILFFAYTSFKRTAGPNWPAFAYFSFSILAGMYLTEDGKFKKVVLIVSFITSFLLSVTATLHARFSIIPLHKISNDIAEADATQFFYGYNELGEEILKHPEIKFALTSSHQLSAEIAYYTHEKVYAYVDTKLTRFSQFNIWGFPDQLRDKDGLYIYLEGDGVGPYRGYLVSVGETLPLDVTRNGYPLRKYRLIRGHGYKGL